MLLIAAAAAAVATSKYFTILVSDCEGWLGRMSAASTTTEEDSEVLRDLVAQTLEREGVLGKIKAQLRWAKGSYVAIPRPSLPYFAPQGPCVSLLGGRGREEQGPGPGKPQTGSLSGNYQWQTGGQSCQVCSLGRAVAWSGQ